ncbi:hypothetical protein N9Y42_06170 [Mariniblastus sp.]|nr:hypothetical protein [Mariniblastus sp.]
MMQTSQIPQGVNAAANPFRTELLERISFRFESGDWDSNLLRLEQMNYRAAIVGRKGSGKTTLLEQLQTRLQQHYVSLPHDRTCHSQVLTETIAASRAGQIVLLDGIERFSFWQRQSLFRNTIAGPGLIVIVHRKCRLKTWVHCRTDDQLMTQLIKDLGFVDPSVVKAGQAAFKKCRGNVREAFLELYDRFADGDLI